MPDEPDDTDVEEQLREIMERLDPVPERLLAAALGSYTWRTADSDLAELVLDSVAEDQGALVRGREDLRLLSFEASGLTIDIQVSSGAPGSAGSSAAGTATASNGAGAPGLQRHRPDTDELTVQGRFAMVPSACCAAPGGGNRPVVTD